MTNEQYNAAKNFADSIWNEMKYELVYDNLIECFLAGIKYANSREDNYPSHSSITDGEIHNPSFIE